MEAAVAAAGLGHPRGSSVPAQLARLGFTDVERVAATMQRLQLAPTDGTPLAANPVVVELAGSADPDRALAGLDRLHDALGQGQARAELRDVLGARPGARRRVLRVLGASPALADHLAAHPGDWRILADDEAVAAAPDAAAHRDRLLAAVGADPAAARPCATADSPETLDALRVAYRRALLVLAARDLTGAVTVDDATAELADLAGAALDAALAIARAGLGPDAPPVRLAVIALGKCGGRELNYVSDVDVIFVAEPEPADPAGGASEAALRTATRLAEGLMRACAVTTAEGALFQVDAGLRPEGRDGALVRTLASHRAYYQRWARTWEFQAMMKARPVAGDLELGAAFGALVDPLVWSAASRPGFVADIRAMRRRVEASVRRDGDRNVKLGPGGLRDVEFAVQLLQLVHGRTDDKLHARGTLDAIDGLARGGYVGRRDGAALADAYRFLRAVEHRLQLRRLRRTHVLPRDPGELRWLGRSLGLRDAEAFSAQYARTVQAVRRLHEKLFYQPLLEAVARLSEEEVRLTPGEAADRLKALGFAYPYRSLRHLEALTAGVSRTAAIQRHLLPTMLPAFADAADPDAGLLAYRQVSEALGRVPWYLRLLRDSAGAADRLARVLAASSYVAELMRSAPESARLLRTEEDLRPTAPDGLGRTLLAVARRNLDADDAVARARAIRRVELVRVSCADLLGLLETPAVGVALTEAATATIEASLLVARRTVTHRLAAGRHAADRYVVTSGADSLADVDLAAEPARLAVIAMGRLGGAEMSYGSDADVIVVHEPGAAAAPAAANTYAAAVVEELVRLLGQPGPDPALRLDLGLRPEGRNGPVTRELAGYAAYYERWSLGWEAQALLRARPVAGDRELGERFTALVEPVRYPAAWPAGAVDEVVRLRARMAAERIPRGADRTLHVKFGPGGLTDVEWAVQVMQLRHAHAQAALRVTGTLQALDTLANLGLLAPADADALRAAWLFASRVRNAVMLARGAPGDQIPRTSPALDRVAGVLGYPLDQVGDLARDYRESAAAARRVVDTILARDR